MSKFKKEYIRRINKVIDYINENLNEDLNLDELAQTAYFSKFHFHRIFKGIINESLYSFIKRLRLEKSVHLILANDELSLTDIAFQTGFNSSANFSFSFKNYFGITPTELRTSKDSKISKIKSNISKDETGKTCYNTDNLNKNCRRLDMKVEVKQMPDFKIAYVRHIGSYFKVGTAWETLCRWTGPRGLLGKSTKMIGMSYDNPEVTPEDKLRYDACITLEQEVEPSGEINLNTIKGGDFAVARFEGKAEEIAQGYHEIFADWMPDSGYQADDRPCMEIYHNIPEEDPDNKFIMDICIPVRIMAGSIFR